MRLDSSRFALSVSFEGDDLVVRAPPLGQLLALRREVRAPVARIEHVDVARAEWPHPLAFRIGTHFPWRIAAGTFYGWRSKRFLYQSAGDRVLRVRLLGGEWNALEIVVPEPDHLARMVRKRAEEARGVKRPS